MKNRTCCFTSHRSIPEQERKNIQKRLEEELEKLILKGVYCFGAGGALGFDTMASQAILKLKRKYPHINLILVLPCKDQTKKWALRDIKIYDLILKKADKIVYTSEIITKTVCRSETGIW